MSILSSSVSLTRYKVKGKIQKPVLDSVFTGLKKNYITEIDNRALDKSVGWVCFDDPFSSNFRRSSFLIGTNIVFSMRIDKKNVPVKMVKKASTVETNIRLKKSNRDFLSKQEKREIKDYVMHQLYIKVPSVPNVYDIIWKYEEGEVLFSSSSQKPNEELESLFHKSFNVNLIKLFPLTMAESFTSISDSEKNILMNISPTNLIGKTIS